LKIFLTNVPVSEKKLAFYVLIQNTNTNCWSIIFFCNNIYCIYYMKFSFFTF